MIDTLENPGEAPQPQRRGMGLFILIWLGQVISILGSGMTSFGLGVEVFRSTGSVSRFALIGLATFLPMLLFSPFAGVLADRRDRRIILILSNIGSALCSLLLYWLVVSGRQQGWYVYAAVAANGAFTAFLWPTLSAATTMIVGREHFGRASGMTQMGASLSRIVAPLLGAAFLAIIALKGIILVDFATFLLSAIILLLVRFPAPDVTEEGRKARGTMKRQVGYAWTFIRERPGLFRLLVLFAGVNFSVGIVPVLFTPLVLGFSSPVVLGLVMSIASSGMLVGGIVMSVWGGAEPHRRVVFILLAQLVQGVVLVLGGLAPNATLITIAAFFFMMGLPIILSTNQAIWQSKVPADLQGRVFAIRSMIVGSSVPIALLVAGPLADHVFEPLMAAGGPLAASVGRWIGVGPGRGSGLFLISLGLLSLLSVIAGFRSRSLRRLEEEIPDAVKDAPDGGAAPASAAAAGPGGVRADEAAAASVHLGVIPAALLFAVLAAGAAGAILLDRRTPPVVTDTAPATDFSAGRAMRHIPVIAQRPHPAGTAANAAVRDYLVVQLKALGLETQVQRTDNVLARPRVVQVATVENVVARLAGTQSGGAVLLVAHYDSVPTGPGASDDGSAVAALLETARALKAGPPLRNDIIFLFTDCEESGLHGARAFVKQHPWARMAKVVLNFDARGNSGPVYMFQTGDRNGWWIQQFLESAPWPVASSLLNEVYRRLTNETDFTVFREAGYAGFNFAFIEGLPHYHNMSDQPAAVEPGSVQHQGSYALALARSFGRLDLSSAAAAGTRQPDRTFFNLLGTRTIHYSHAVAIASAALAVLLFLAVVVLGLRRGRLSPFGLWQGFLSFFGVLIAVPVVVTLIWFLVRDAASVPVVMNSTRQAAFFMIAFACLALSLFACLFRFFRRGTSALNLAVGAQLWWVLLVLLTSGLWLPAQSNFLFVWPLLGSLLAAAYLIRTPRMAQRPWLTVVVLSLAALPGLLLVAPTTALLYVSFQSLAQLGGTALTLEVLLLGLLIPHLDALMSLRFRWLPALSTLAGLVFLGIALWSPGKAELPRVESSVLYAWDVDAGQRFWFSYDPAPNAWTRQFGFASGRRESFTRFLPLLPQKLMRSPAPAADVPQPVVEVLEQSEHGDVRELRLRLRTAANSQVRFIWFDPPEAVISARLGGTPVVLTGSEPGVAPLLMRLQVPVPEEEMTLRLKGKGAVTMTVVEQLDGLPNVLGLRPRSPEMMPRPFLTAVRSDVTLVRRSFSLVAPGATEAPVPGGN